MSLTIREKILQQMMTRLAVITTVNGYGTDIGTNVIRARRSVDPDELPATVLWPGTEKVEDALYGMTRCSMTVRVEGLTIFGSENPSIVSERILGDLIMCLVSSAWVRDPEYMTGIAYRGGGTDSYPEESDKAVGAYADFLVTYETKTGDPFSQ